MGIGITNFHIFQDGVGIPGRRYTQHPAGIYGEFGGVPQAPLRQLLGRVGAGENGSGVTDRDTDRLSTPSRPGEVGLGEGPTGLIDDL